MNFLTKREDDLETMPKKERFRKNPDKWYSGWNFPYRRVHRWIESKVGNHIDDVISEYVNAEWIPLEFRQRHNLYRYLQCHTFLVNGKVCYHDGSPYYLRKEIPYNIVENQGTKTFYVDPTTRKVCVFYPKSRKWDTTLWKQQQMMKLVILGDYHQYNFHDGIWYEIKAEPCQYQTDIANYNHFRKGPNDNLLVKTNRYNNRNSKNPYVKITLKRQLNHKELKQNGLRNCGKSPKIQNIS